MQLFRMFGEVALKGGEAVISGLQVIDKQAKKTELQLRKIPNKVETEIDVDTDRAEGNIARLIGKVETLQAVLMAMGPAVVPMMASLGALAGGLGASFLAAGAGVASFAAIAIPALNGIFDASEEIEKIQEKLAKADTAKERAKALKELQAVYSGLTTQERAALKALQDFKSFWSGFVDSFKSPVLDMFIKGLNSLKGALNSLKPVFEASISAVSGLFDGMNKALKGNQMQKFFDWLAVNVGPAITTFGTAFGNVMTGIINLLMAFSPVTQDVQSGLVGLTQRFAEWSAGLSQSQGFKQFIEYAKANGPILMDILGQVGTLFVQLTQAMAPFGPIVLQIVQGILQFVNWLLQLHPAVGMTLVGLMQLVGAVKLLSGPVMFAKDSFFAFKDIITKIGPTIMSFATGIIPRLVSGFKSILTAFNVLRAAMLTNPFGLIITAIGLLIAAGIALYQNWDSVKAFLQKIWNGIKSTAQNVMKAIVTFIKNHWNQIKSSTTVVWNAIKSFFSSIWSGIKSFVSSAVNGIKSTITSIWNGIKSITSSVWNGIKSIISQGISAAWNFIKGYASSFLSAGRGLLDALVKGIKAGISKAISAVKSGMAAIRKYLPFSPAKEGPLSDLDKSGESFFPTFAQGVERGSRPMLRSIAQKMAEARRAMNTQGGAGTMDPAKLGNVTPAVAPAGSLISGNTFIIREEADIERVARRLYQLQREAQRGPGVRR